MANFDYSARRSDGGTARGSLSAHSAEAAAGQLRTKGMRQVKVAPGKAKGAGGGQIRLPSFGAPVKAEELILFCRQMGSLLKAGVPISRALKGMVEMSDNADMSEVLSSILADLEGGRELSAAMAQHPRIFSLLFVSMVRVGESSGKLDEAFEQVSRYLAQEKDTADRVKAAMRYPTFVVVAIGAAIAVISLFVIPAFEGVFKGMGMEMPLATKILMAISHFARDYWPFIVGAMVLSFVGFRRYVRTGQGRYRWGRIKLRLPLVGSIILRATLTRFARSFAMGYGSGVPLVQTLSLTAKAVDNDFVGQKLEEVRNSVERGATLTHSAAATGLFTPLVLQMLSVGEETGAVDTMLKDVGDFYEREVDYDLSKLTGAIEPILVTFMGGMVLVLALGVFLPMWNMSTMAGGG